MNKILRTKTYLVLFLMLAILIIPAQAALIVNKVTDEFSLESQYPQENLKACQCSTRTDVLEIKNIGDFDALFTVEIYSPIKDLIILSDTTFELAPCEEKKVYAYIDIPCEAPLESFYVARVKTNYGRSKEIYKEIVSKQCQNIKLNCEVLNEGEILPGDTITIKADLQNVADFTDNYQIRAGAYEEFTVLSQEEISLAQDEEATIYAYVQYPLTHYGTFKHSLMIVSEKGENQVFCTNDFIIEKDYDFAIQTETFEIETCEDITKKAEITITNLAEQTPNKYYLHLTAPGFVKLDQNTLGLEAGEEATITMTLNPAQADVGEYQAILSIGTEYGDMHKEKSFKIIVNDCFKTSIVLEEQEELFADKACCGEKTFTLNLRNDGMYEEAYAIIVDSAGWVDVREEDRFVRLRASQNKDIPVIVNYPCLDSEQTSFITVKQLRAPYETHEMRLDLQSLSLRSCYNVDLIQDKYKITFGTVSIPMLLQNTGLRGGTYQVELGELESRFVHLDQDKITFEAGETKVLHVYPKDQKAYKEGTYLNKLSLEITLLNEDCEPECITEEEIDITYNRQFWVVLRDKNFVYKAIDYIRNFNYSRIGWCGLITLVLAGLSGIMLIIVAYMRLKPDMKVKRIKAKCMKTIKAVNIVLIFLLIISILALILIGSPRTEAFYEPGYEEASPLLHEWNQNTPYQLDLDMYFTDPDLDVLSYTASQPNHVQVKIAGSIATLTPEHNWAGEEPIVFTANDEKGGLTDSPIMTLRVLKKKPIGILGYWNAYCTHINLVIFIVLVLLTLLFFDVLEDKGYNYYKPGKNAKKARKKKK